MKYFLHDSNAFNDEKITELFISFGYEGLGLFYTALEKIAAQEKPIKTTILKSQLKVGKRLEKCWNFIEEIGLLSSNNGVTFNEQLLNFSEKYQIKKEKTREKVAEWRKRQADTENVTGYVPVSNLPKVKESKVNENKINKNILDFDSCKLELLEHSQIWHEKILMSDLRVKSTTELKSIINKFLLLKNSTDSYFPANISNVKEHFVNWLKTQKIEANAVKINEGPTV